MPSRCAIATTGRKFSRLCAIVVLMLCCVKLSLAAVNTAIACTPAAKARSMPFTLGTSTGYEVPARFAMRVITSLASLNCGMARGLTNEVASTTGKPASASNSIKRIFCSVGMRAFSFCSPSRGPTSTTRTYAGNGGSAVMLTRLDIHSYYDHSEKDLPHLEPHYYQNLLYLNRVREAKACQIAASVEARVDFPVALAALSPS